MHLFSGKSKQASIFRKKNANIHVYFQKKHRQVHFYKKKSGYLFSEKKTACLFSERRRHVYFQNLRKPKKADALGKTRH